MMIMRRLQYLLCVKIKYFLTILCPLFRLPSLSSNQVSVARNTLIIFVSERKQQDESSSQQQLLHHSTCMQVLCPTKSQT